MSPSKNNDSVTRGYVIPIGGAEERTGAMTVLKQFVELCGGQESNIAIIPTASLLADTGDKYIEIFNELGVTAVESLPITERTDAADDRYLAALDNATGIFMTGGNQTRLSTIIGGTEVAQKIRRLNANGVHVAGTSAGAAIMSEHMIVGGGTGLLPSAGGVTLAPGLGLTNSLLVDQHFSQRDRFGRLLTAISYNPFLLGVGIDEDTAIFIGPDSHFEVFGSGAVTIVDPSALTYSSMGNASGNEPLSLLNLKLHFLSTGCRFDISSRTPFPPG